MVLGAEQWSSGTFWAATSVVVALVIGVATFLVTWMPRQRLYYRAPPITPLLARGTRGIADLEILPEGRLLTDPHLLEVTLTARGRRDIPRSAFDQGPAAGLRPRRMRPAHGVHRDHQLRDVADAFAQATHTRVKRNSWMHLRRLA